MEQFGYLTALAYVFLGELVAFSLCQLLLMRRSNRVHIGLWLVASGLSAVGTAGAPHLLTVVSIKNFEIWAGLAALAGGVGRYFAVTYRRKSFSGDRMSRFFLFLTLAGLPLAIWEPLLPFRLLLTSVVGAAISLACFFGMLNNPIWKSRSRFGLSIALVGMLISASALAARGLTSYPFGSDQFFVGTSNFQVRAFETLVLISFFLQMGFTAMIVARRGQEDLFVDRRAVRTILNARLRAKRMDDLARLSHERLELIQLLTHEVRQPINNAQASLQSIALNLGSAPPISDRASHVLARAQSSLDDITLALSNVIVAATLVSPAKRWEPQQVDAIAIFEMARLDCPPTDQPRIRLHVDEEHLYAFGMPILLRIALHNLLDHAAKTSIPGSEIVSEIRVDPVHLILTFKIVFETTDASNRTEEMFLPRRSSDSTASKIPSLGLFVVRLAARAHGGEISALSPAAGKIRLNLSIPY